MVSARALAGRAGILALVLGVVSAGPASWACSDDPPRPDLVVFRPDGRGVTALLSPTGTVVSLSFEGGGWAHWALAGRLGGLSAALSEDGSTLVTLVPSYAADSGHCAVDRVTVRATSLRTGRTTVVGELGASPTYLDFTPEISPTGRRVAIWAPSYATGDAYQEIFDVETGERERVVPAEDLAWIDDDLFVVEGPSGGLDVMRASDGATLGDARGGPSAGRLGLLAAHPARSAVTVVEAGTTLITATVASGRVSVERRALPRPLWEGREGDPNLVAWSDDYTRIVRRRLPTGRLPYYEVLDATTGEVLWRISGQAVYTTVRLSPDGGALALVSHEPILFDGLGDTEMDGDPTLELVDLTSGHVVSWGARARTVASRP